MKKILSIALGCFIGSYTAQAQELIPIDQLVLNTYSKEIYQNLPSSAKWKNDNTVLFEYRTGEKSKEYDIKKGTFTEVDGGAQTPLRPPMTNSPIKDAKNYTVSPDGKFAAYTKTDNNLYSYDIENKKEIQLTFDGTEFIKNGWASWVYFEEILGRASRYKAFWFSPDSKSIAYFRFDDTKLPTFPIYVIKDQYGYLENETYPKAGDHNPKVKIGITPVSEAKTTWADFDQEVDQYFGEPVWTPNNKLLAVWMDRDQTQLKIYDVNIQDGSKKLWYEETQSTWITLDDVHLNFLSNNDAIFTSDKDGWQNLYLISNDGSKVNQITTGSNWGTRIIRIDEKNKVVYYTARKENSARYDLYKASFDGKKVQRLTFGDYNFNIVALSPNGKHFVASYSNATTPTTMAIINENGKVVKEIGNIKGKDFDKYALPKTELIRVKSKDGKFDLPVYITYPVKFDPNKKYPVLVSIYGGPNAGRVMDTYKQINGMSQLWAQEGLIQVEFDNRSSGHFGKEGMNYIHRQLGIWEIEDYITCAKYLTTQPWVDATKIAITGGSFGGYMTCMALTYGADVFTHGVANASVTDWQFYDTHYTERFMDTPQDNAEGYKKTSVMEYAHKLKGVLRINHGTSDDNVHFQNSLQLVDKLQELGKEFELMIYPGERHSIGANSPAKSLHYRKSTYDFYYKHLLEKPMPEVLKNLKPTARRM